MALGAFGAHALRGRLSPEMLAVFETGVRYQMYHTLALLITGLVMARIDGWLIPRRRVVLRGRHLDLSGSLYALALTGVTVLGAITPIGGLAFLAGWACPRDRRRRCELPESLVPSPLVLVPSPQS